MVREGKTKATITIDVEAGSNTPSGTTLTTKISSERGQDILQDKTGSVENHLVCGYGISRVNEGPDTGRKYRVIDSVYSLFQYEQTLVQTELTLRRLRDFLGTKHNKYERVLDKIKQALGLEPTDTIELAKRGGVRISGRSIGTDIPLEGWADGYRKTLAWILDLYAWALRAGCITNSGDVKGVILVDELEQHLHPSMQTRLPARLSELLPSAQIIATTHSPLVALGRRSRRASRPSNAKTGTSPPRPHPAIMTGIPLKTCWLTHNCLTRKSTVPIPQTNFDGIGKSLRHPHPNRSPAESKEFDRLRHELSALQIHGIADSPALQELQRVLKKHNL